MSDKSAVRTWISTFLKARDMDCPSGQPLYKYGVNETEFFCLVSAIKSSGNQLHSPTFGKYWAAAFCIFVAEQYRRDYQKTWAWQGFDKIINTDLSPTDRATVVKKGLTFWKRNIQRHSFSADYLGTLFSEGGLPWALIQSDKHGFARAISGGIKRYYTTRSSSLSLNDIIREYEQYFPLTFRTEEKYQLLSSIVESLMYLAELIDLSSEKKPSEALNRHYPGWQSKFPLPITESNGIALVDKWLGDAANKRLERKQAIQQSQYFTCSHNLIRIEPIEQYESQVVLAPSHIILLKQPTTGVRVDMLFIEGDKTLLRLGSTYGKLNNEQTSLSVQLTQEPIRIIRQDITQPLYLSLEISGQQLDQVLIQDSDIAINDVPVAFDLDESNLLEDLPHSGSMSASTSKSQLLVRLPKLIKYFDVDLLHIIHISPNAKWLRINKDIVISDLTTKYIFKLNQPFGRVFLSVQGVLAPIKTYPNITYLGWPRIITVDSNNDPIESSIYINDEPVSKVAPNTQLGSYQLTAYGKAGELLARKKIGVLPIDFDYSGYQATQNTEAKIILRSNQRMEASISDSTYSTSISHLPGVCEIGISRKSPSETSPPVDIIIKPSSTEGSSITLQLPFPKAGATLIDEHGDIIESRTLTIDELIGKRLELSSSTTGHQTYNIVFSLINAKYRQSRMYQYIVSKSPVVISLGGLIDDLIAILSSQAKQDLTARISIETTTILRQFDIKRHNGHIIFGKKTDSFFEIRAEQYKHFIDTPAVLAIPLSGPSQKPLSVKPSAYDDESGWRFDYIEEMRDGEPWLIYPDSESKFNFRPSFFSIEMFSNKTTPSILHPRTMGEASKAFHPSINPSAFDQVIQNMSENPVDEGWEYMKSTKLHLSHLPLASLEAWRALCYNPRALALATLRLEIGAIFAERMSNELSVLWESIQNTHWVHAISLYCNWLVELTALPEPQVRNIVADKLSSLASVIPLFEDFIPELVLDKYGPQKLPLAASYMLLHKGVRQLHADDKWPEMLTHQLLTWVENHANRFKWLSLSNSPKFTYAVSITPLFLASLTLGQTKISDLGEDEDYIRYALRCLRDFDRYGWCAPIYKTVLVQYSLKGNHQNEWYDN